MAESFGTDAERYDRARPRYPQALIDRLLEAMPGRDILDVGCGTGIVARQFQAAGGQVLGIEPDSRMADLARHFGVEVEPGKFEDWDPAGRLFDAAVAGQAWHWVDPVAGAAKAAQALRPGGLLAVFWNAFEPPPEVGRAFAEAFDCVMPDSPLRLNQLTSATDAYAIMVNQAEEGVRTAGGFGDSEQWRFEWQRSYTREEWLDQLPTAGCLTRAPADQLTEILAAVGAAIDGIGGRFTVYYTTLASVSRRQTHLASVLRVRPGLV
jgi:SAM-dependent methyltransferase